MALSAHLFRSQPAALPQQRPPSINALIARIQHEFPAAHIRVTGRARTIRRQAELMAQRIRADEDEFLGTYRDSHHIRQMVAWYETHAGATEAATTGAFEEIIRRARASGAVVSNHLSDNARDISWPRGNEADLRAIQNRIRQLGGSVIREADAAGGAHWHVDWAAPPPKSATVQT